MVGKGSKHRAVFNLQVKLQDPLMQIPTKAKSLPKRRTHSCRT